jgi:hypothetical protein
LACLFVAVAAAGCSGARHSNESATTAGGGSQKAVASHARDGARHRDKSVTIAQRSLGLPPVHSRFVPGYVLIADRNNNRVLLVSPAKKVVWSATNLRGPDDAFFTPGYRSVITNEEFNDTLTELSLRTKRRIWHYGHGGIAGSSPGYLNTPDDAYRLPNGETTVADIRNCRVVYLRHSGAVARVLGGSCAHDPPYGFSSPNGATPLPGGGLLVTEIGGWIDRISANGSLLWSIRSPVTYPSDAQLLPDGRVLVASFSSPGRIVIVDRSGRVDWSFGSASGPDYLDKPSLAIRWPNGMIAANDDYNERVIVIDPRTKRIVWQYGHTGVAGTAPGFLNKPDGIDLLPGEGAAPPAPARKAKAPVRPTVTRLQVKRVGSLPEAASRVSAVALPGGRILALGGLVAGSSTDQILRGPPAALRAVGHLPTPTHDAAAALVGRSAYLFGGGEAVSSPAVVRVDPATGAATPAGSLGEPLSDLGAATVAGQTYLVGGYTGSRFATAVLRFRPGRPPALVTRLPAGLRYAGVAALGDRIYVAGGLTTAGDTSQVLAVDPARRSVTRVATLLRPLAHVALAPFGSRLLLVGGGSARILAIDPQARTVTTAGRLPSALADPTAVALNGHVFVLGGGTNAVYELG